MVALPTWIAGGNADTLDICPGVVNASITFDIGATGAPTLRTGQGSGTGYVTVSRTSAGLYNLAFAAGRVKSLKKCGVFVNLVAATTGGVWAALTEDDAAGNSSPNITVTCYAVGGVVATDPANGNSVTVDLKLSVLV
jgi:hypothetical protein